LWTRGVVIFSEPLQHHVLIIQRKRAIEGTKKKKKKNVIYSVARSFGGSGSLSFSGRGLKATGKSTIKPESQRLVTSLMVCSKSLLPVFSEIQRRPCGEKSEKPEEAPTNPDVPSSLMTKMESLSSNEVHCAVTLGMAGSMGSSMLIPDALIADSIRFMRSSMAER
jgi:hypothetical protein